MPLTFFSLTALVILVSFFALQLTAVESNSRITSLTMTSDEAKDENDDVIVIGVAGGSGAGKVCMFSDTLYIVTLHVSSKHFCHTNFEMELDVL